MDTRKFQTHSTETEKTMRKLISLLAVGVFLSVAGYALADNTPTTSSPTTTTTTTPAPAHWFAGTVTGVGSASLTVGVLWTGPNDGSLNGQTITVTTTDNTRISRGKQGPIALASIQNGDLVAVRADGTAPSGLTARRIHVQCNCHWIGGTIGTVGTSSFTVNVKRTGPYDTVLNNTTVTIQVNDLTVYLRNHRGRRIGFSDLQPNEPVGVVFASSGFFKAPGFDPTTATFTAKRVRVWGPRQTPLASADASAAANVAA
jgi:hypothetical protein